MATTDIIRNTRTMNDRYERHIESGNHVLLDGSQQEIAHGTVDYFREVDENTGKINTNGCQVAPGGMGKTIWAGDFIVGINTMPNGRFVLGDKTLGKRTLITVHTNDLVQQWGDRLLGDRNEEGTRKPSIFGDRFTPENVGIYNASDPEMTDAKRKEILSKPVVIMTHDSMRALYEHRNSETGEHEPLFHPEQRDACIIDEVDDKVRGDVTREFYKEHILPNCMTVGMTATPLLRDGKTIMDYLFASKKPICQILHEEAIQRGEVAGHVNMIAEVDVDPSSVIKVDTNRWDDYTEAQQMQFIKQTGLDDKLQEIIKTQKHPAVGKPLKDMMQLHQAVNVEHAKLIAKHLNEALGKKQANGEYAGYAAAVWGDMDPVESARIERDFRAGKIKAVVQCKLWGRGKDFPELEMTVQHAPSLAPGKTEQFHTRASRNKHDKKKISLLLSPYINGIDQLVIGELLGGLWNMPPGFEFPQTAGKAGAPEGDPEPYPEIAGVKVHATQRQLAIFKSKLDKIRYANGLPLKTKDVLTPDQMAKELGIEDVSVVMHRLFEPMERAYRSKSARDKVIRLTEDETVFARGHQFPAHRMGYYSHEKAPVFCVDKMLSASCEEAFYGSLYRTSARPELLNKANAKELLGCTDAARDELWKKLQTAFFEREGYKQSVEIDGMKFSFSSFGFYRNKAGSPEFFITPDALEPAYQLVHGANQERVDAWSQQPAIRQCKTSEWFTQTEVMSALGITNPMGENGHYVKALFGQIKTASRGMRAGEERTLGIGRGKDAHTLQYAKRWLPQAEGDDQNALCLSRQDLEWVKSELGSESAYDPSQGQKAGQRK
jgi:superfamily II DNA or RNA helicase